MKATATANPNIALVKYWGKRDEHLILPKNSSISVTLDGLFTKTTVEFGHEKDTLILNGNPARDKELEKIAGPLNIVRKRAGINEHARIESENNFPTAAGLASSASGFAALALAASKAAGLDIGKKELSMLARRGSGSASRSVESGFVEWLSGSADDGSDSYAIQIAPKEHWPEFRIIIAITSLQEKKIKSRTGMSNTVATSPLYEGWLKSVSEDLDNVRKAIINKDFTSLGKTAEQNALKMHATMITTKPAIVYWTSATMEVMHALMQWRNELESYFTIDAGPQVKIMALKKHTEEIKSRLSSLDNIEDVIVCKPGDGASLSKEHLF